jgi:hypothetical protein
MDGYFPDPKDLPRGRVPAEDIARLDAARKAFNEELDRVVAVRARARRRRLSILVALLAVLALIIAAVTL